MFCTPWFHFSQRMSASVVEDPEVARDDLVLEDGARRDVDPVSLEMELNIG